MNAVLLLLAVGVFDQPRRQQRGDSAFRYPRPAASTGAKGKLRELTLAKVPFCCPSPNHLLHGNNHHHQQHLQGGALK